MTVEENTSMKKIAKAAIIFLIGMICIKLLTYVFRIIVARIGLEEYGLISIGLAVYGIISVLCIFGMDTGLYGLLSTSIKKEEEEKRKQIITGATKFSLGLSLILSFLLFLLSSHIAITYFHNENLTIILQIISIAIPFGVVRSIIQSSLRAFQLVKLDTITRVLENLSRLLIVILLLYVGLGVIGVALAYTISIFISFLIAIFFLQWRILKIWENKKHPTINKELLQFSWPLLLNNLSILIFNWTDTITLGIFQDATQVGLYNTAAPTASLLSIVNKSIMTLFLPITATVYMTENKEELKKILKTTLRWIFLINSFGVVILLIFSKEILSIFFGSEYAIASTALVILSLFYMISSLSDVPREVLLMLKKTKTIWYVTLVGIIANIIFNILLIPKWGIEGAAFATGFSYLLTTITFFLVTYKETKVILFSNDLLKISIAIAGTIVIVLFIKEYFSFSILNTILLIIITTILHTGILFFLQCIKKEERDIIKAGIQKIRSGKI